MVTQITPINLIPGTMIPRVNISQYDTGARVLKFQVYNGDSLFTFTNAMSVALVGTKPDGKGFSYTGTIASNMPTFDVTAQMSAVAGKVRAELVVFESGERVGSGNFVIFVEEGALGDGTDMSDSDYAIINDALEAAFDLDHFYADLQNMVTEAVEDIQVQQGQTVIDPTLTISGAAADAKATGDMARNFLEALMAETTDPAPVATCDDAAGGLPVKKLTANIEPTQSGTGDPSPDNVCPISGYTGVEVQRNGKNLFRPAASGGSSANVSYVRNDDYSLTFTGQANGTTRTPSLGTRILKAGTYILSGVSGGSADTYALRIANTAGVTSGCTVYDGEGTFVVETDGAIIVQGRFSNVQTAAYNVTMYPMIRLASETDDTYEPYNGETYPVTFPTEAGTVYGGTLIVNSDGSGALTVDTAIITSVTASDLVVNTNSATLYRIFFPATKGYTLNEHSVASVFRSAGVVATITSHLWEMFAFADGRLFMNCDPTIMGITTSDTIAVSREKFVEWFNTNNVQIVATLSTPTTYALSAVQVAQMLQGDNNIWMDAAGTVQATYYANTALYVEKRIAELQALVLENQ